MTANGSDRAEFEGQIFAIPGNLVGRKGALAEWITRGGGVIAGAIGVWLVVAGIGNALIPVVVAFLLLVLAYVLLTASWNLRCRRFGWRFRYIGTWQYIDAREDRTLLTSAAPDVPANREDAHTSFTLRPVRRLDGSKTW